MKRIVLVLVSVFLCVGSASAGIGGQVGLVAGVAPPSCGSSAKLYSNATRDAIRFDLALSNTGGCAVTLGWTDADGHPQTLTVAPGFSQGISSIEVSRRSAITWTSVIAPSGGLAFQWQLERVPPPRGEDDEHD